MAISSDYLKPQWQKKRLEILERDNFTCSECGDKENTLHVHHSHYRKGLKVWEYDNCSLFTLCESCHKTKHEEIKRIDPMKIQRLMDLYYGYHDFICDIKQGGKDLDFYRDCIMQTIQEKEYYIINNLCEDEPRCDEYISNFTLLEALMFNKVRLRNVKTYVDGCFMMAGDIIEPSVIGKELLSVSRDLNRSVF